VPLPGLPSSANYQEGPPLDSPIDYHPNKEETGTNPDQWIGLENKQRCQVRKVGAAKRNPPWRKACVSLSLHARYGLLSKSLRF